MKKRNQPFSNVKMTIDEGTTAKDVIRLVGLEASQVEVVFINGKVSPQDTVLTENDRVALVPPGTPGPYRVLLGFKNKANQ